MMIELRLQPARNLMMRFNRNSGSLGDKSKTGERIEWKERTSEKVEMLSLEEVVRRLKI